MNEVTIYLKDKYYKDGIIFSSSNFEYKISREIPEMRTPPISLFKIKFDVFPPFMPDKISCIGKINNVDFILIKPYIRNITKFDYEGSIEVEVVFLDILFLH